MWVANTMVVRMEGKICSNIPLRNSPSYGAASELWIQGVAYQSILCSLRGEKPTCSAGECDVLVEGVNGVAVVLVRQWGDRRLGSSAGLEIAASSREKRGGVGGRRRFQNTIF